jgi:hypothetical protein
VPQLKRASIKTHEPPTPTSRGVAPAVPIGQTLWTGNQSRLRHLPLQRKLLVGSVDDPLEHQADRVADRVMRFSNPVEPSALASSEFPKLDHHTDADKSAPNSVADALRSSGQPLDASTLAFFEPRFGRNFSNVRIHTDTLAAQSAQALNASAYTVQNDIFFNRSQFSPTDRVGRQLLAHELTHVSQQNAISELATGANPRTSNAFLQRKEQSETTGIEEKQETEEQANLIPAVEAKRLIFNKKIPGKNFGWIELDGELKVWLKLSAEHGEQQHAISVSNEQDVELTKKVETSVGEVKFKVEGKPGETPARLGVELGNESFGIEGSLNADWRHPVSVIFKRPFKLANSGQLSGELELELEVFLKPNLAFLGQAARAGAQTAAEIATSTGFVVFGVTAAYIAWGAGALYSVAAAHKAGDQQAHDIRYIHTWALTITTALMDKKVLRPATEGPAFRENEIRADWEAYTNALRVLNGLTGAQAEGLGAKLRAKYTSTEAAATALQNDLLLSKGILVNPETGAAKLLQSIIPR